ncbi:MAG: D-tyrosyl-tRNA(Tyr) deacylase [Clostridiales Family XIII bacterium]|jgi:D-tyrosyl-tRNA(Tyr) deacylase|nr:D-tyrosyl-tRNA(Tyr) deacylase [Clostridiales Family XIII bacterium]
MRAVVQRVTEADVTVFDGDPVAGADGGADDARRIGRAAPGTPRTGRVAGRIGSGLVVFLGVEEGDGEADAAYMADKVCGLRVFDDADGKMNLSVMDVADGMILAVSQFTLLGDVRKGKRPSFTAAAKPAAADALYRSFVDKAASKGVRVEEGVFRADMLVRILNDGPVTILMDSRKTF